MSESWHIIQSLITNGGDTQVNGIGNLNLLHALTNLFLAECYGVKNINIHYVEITQTSCHSTRSKIKRHYATHHK